MEKITLQAELRQSRGTNANRRLRLRGLVPAVVYGRGSDPVSLQFNPKSLLQALQGGESATRLISLDISGTKKDSSRLVLLKEVQRDPLTQAWSHVDFLEVNMKEAITVPVPLRYVGKAAGLVQGGIVDIQRRQLNISCLPADIPTHIDVDVTQLNIGDSLHISDIQVAAGLTIVDSAHLTLATVVVPGKEEEPAAVSEEEAAAAEAAAAEGEQPAAAKPEAEADAKEKDKEKEKEKT